MQNLWDFPPPREGEVSLCAVDGVLYSGNESRSNITSFTLSVSMLCDIT